MGLTPCTPCAWHTCIPSFPQVYHTGELRAIAISQSEVEAISQSEVKVALALGDATPAAVAPTASTRAAWADRLSSVTPPIVMATPRTSERDSN